MPKVLITGVGGFLGKYIAKEFVKKGWTVFGIDILSIPANEIKHLGFESLLRADLRSSDFGPWIRQIQPHLVIQAAGPSSVHQSVLDPELDFNLSVHSLFHLLNVLRTCSFKSRIIFLSSAAVYGNPKYLPVKEEDPLNPISPYGYHKCLGEKILKEFFEVYKIRGCSVRIFSAFGPGLRRQIFWDICRKIFFEPVITLKGTGNETRDFIYAEDVARGIVLLAEKADFNGEVYNLAGGEGIKINDLSSKILDQLMKKPKIDFSGTSDPGDPLYLRADMSRLARLGFAPEISIEEGIRRTINWFLEQHNIK